MKILVLSALCISLCQGDAASSQDTKSKSNIKSANSFTSPQKQELQLQPMLVHQPQPQFYPVQFLSKPLYLPHQPPTAMVIIAQPALVPQHLLYGSQMQQLLNYFHNNPQARYQFLHGYQSQQSTQPYVSPHNSIASSSLGNYQVIPAQHLQYVAAPSHLSYAQSQSLQNSLAAQYSNVHPMALNDIAHLAQLTAQTAASSVPSLPIRSAPAIITGLENFTPEQQVQIKAQLNAHLTPQLSTPASTDQSQNQAISSGYGLKYYSGNSQSEFSPSPQIKNEEPATTSNHYHSSDIYRSQYAKG